MTVVSGVLLDHVEVDPAQVEIPRTCTGHESVLKGQVADSSVRIVAFLLEDLQYVLCRHRVEVVEVAREVVLGAEEAARGSVGSTARG